MDTTKAAADKAADWLLIAAVTPAPLWVWMDWLEWGLSIASMVAGLCWAVLKIRRELRDTPPKADK
jgi:hypothetical protein